MKEVIVVFFFFSSRRRHTRCGRDWSSDVCSSEYNRQVEAKVGAAVIAAAGTPVTTFATEAEFSALGAAYDSIIDLGVAVLEARKLPADLLVMRTRRWGAFKKLKDSEGRDRKST